MIGDLKEVTFGTDPVHKRAERRPPQGAAFVDRSPYEDPIGTGTVASHIDATVSTVGDVVGGAPP
jgi:hypothetical protein